MIPQRITSFATVRESENPAYLPDILVVKPEILLNRHHGHEVTCVTIVVRQADIVGDKLSFKLEPRRFRGVHVCDVDVVA